MTDAPSPEELFLEHLDLIERLLLVVARRYGLRDTEAEEFAAGAKLRMIEDDYAVLRKFRGDARIDTYLTTVFVRIVKDWLIARRGKWRPCAKALHHGTEAVQLDKLISFDGRTIEESVEIVKRNLAGRSSRAELFAIAEELPRHPPRRFVSDAAIATEAARDDADRGLRDSERSKIAERVGDALNDALESLDPEDRLVLQLRFDHGSKVSEISRTLDLDQRRLYTRIANLLKRLKERIESTGTDFDEVQQILGWSKLELDVGYGGAGGTESGRPGPSNG